MISDSEVRSGIASVGIRAWRSGGRGVQRKQGNSSTGSAPVSRDLGLFATFLFLGAIAANINVNIPNTEAFIEIRWAFGYMGIALIRRTWLAFLLTCLLSIALISNTPIPLVFFGNMAYAMPGFVMIRLLHNRWFVRLTHPVAYGAAWFLLVIGLYQAFNTPLVWAVLAYINKTSVVESVLESWRTQPYLLESVLTAMLSALGMVAFRIHDDLRTSEQRFRLLSEATTVGVLIHRDGRLLDANNVFFDKLGYEPAELYRSGVDILEKLIPPEELAAVRERAARGEETYETVVVRKDGSRFPARVHASSINYGGSPARAGAVADITQEKSVEDRLRQSQKLEALGQLAGGITHDFNNQLGGIVGYCEMLEKRLDDPKLKHYAGNIQDCAQRAGDLTQQLLAFARRGKYQSIPVDLHGAIERAIAILERSIDKRITITRRFEADPATTLGDPTLLESLLLNLGLNARDAMPDGGELIFDTRITALDADYCRSLPYDIRPGRFVRICVTDTGCGMSRFVLEHLFEPFFTTKEVGKGTGMGLAAVYGTVKQHAGAVNVYSEPGHGTTFRVYLPLVDAAAEKGPEAVEALRAEAPACVLIVEDEEILRNVAAQMLVDLGYQVRLQVDGESAVRYYRDHWREIDIVLLDMIMPVMNGQDAYRAMKEINPEVRVLLASGYSLNGAAQAMLDEGVRGFLQKPYRQAELAAKVAETLAAGEKDESRDG